MTTAQQSTGRYDYHDQYYSLNIGAHRKGGIELLTPTLSHHLGLWYPPASSGAGEPGERSVDKFGAAVDRYVWTLYRPLRGFADFETNFAFVHGADRVVCLFGGIYHAEGDVLTPYKPNGDDFHYALEDARDSDNKILFMKARWQGLTITVRCEFHSEYFTATRFVTVTDFADIPASASTIGEAFDHLTKLNKDHPVADEATEMAHVELYARIWELLDEEIFDWSGVFADFDTTSRLRIFADFRGLVISGNNTTDTGPLSLASSKDGTKTGFGPDYAADHLLPSIWPFLKVRNGLDLKRREFTASHMLGGRAVYITALGPQPPASNRFDCAPLQYLLVARPVSDWQLGALVDRLHFMGTVRLAALMELKALREAGANLRDMEHEAEAARRAIDDDDTTTALLHYQRAMVLISHKGKNGVPIFWAGLQFRVERSRYYAKRFRDFVAFLGIDPIEGYQPYHHFVRARLGGVYDYIDRLGHRQERAVRSTESIFQLISLLEAAEANRQSAIANERSAEANAQSAEANKRNSIISKTIEKLQTKAELALVAIIIPHYVIEIINDLESRAKNNENTIWREDVSILTIGVSFACLSLLVYILERGEFDRERLKRFALKYIVAALVSAAVVVFLVHP